MNDNSKSPITLMAELLAAMTERAVEAERQRDAAKEGADNWYRHYLTKDEQLKAAREQIENMKKGATENG